jgi:uncharacterized BrkB/YihY/UPF0761 family membrane protein
MIFLLVFLQSNASQIEEKIKNAPDSSYEIGVVIGTYLPFVFLAGLAWLFYYFVKRKNKDKQQ